MEDAPRSSSNVIRVAFGNVPLHPEAVLIQVTDADDPPEAQPADPVASVYTRAEVARIFALDAARLRSWERAGLVRPSAEDSGKRYYTFQDLVAIRAAKGLVEHGVSVARIRRAVEALRKTLPGTSPLTELRITSNGKALAVRRGASTFDPLTGQLLLDFDLRSVREDVVRALPVTRTRRDARTAYDWFLEGCRLDGDETTTRHAEQAYRRALRLDPALASAYTNLGALRLRAGDPLEAEGLFMRALNVEPDQAEAAYNLGFMKLESGATSEAVDWLQFAIEREPEFADAHYNLAKALSAAGRASEAIPHWASYLALSPDGRYAAIARKRLPHRR